jgi:hypothetical protein
VLNLGNEYSHNFEFSSEGDTLTKSNKIYKCKSFHSSEMGKNNKTSTFELMQAKRNNFVDNPQDQTVYLEYDFEHYPMFSKKMNGSLYKTHDGGQSRDQLPKDSKKRIMQYRQNSTKNLSYTMNKVQTKRLTHRGANRLDRLNASAESLKNLKHFQNVANNFLIDNTNSQVSPSKKARSNDRNHEKEAFMQKKIEKKREEDGLKSVFSKSCAHQKKVLPSYHEALMELKMKSKKNNSSSRGRKKIMKLNATSKIPHQATVCNSNTSRKTPLHNTKLGNANIRQSKKLLNKELHKITKFQQINIRKKNITKLKNKQLDSQITTNLMKMMKQIHNQVPKAGIHYRARTTEIGNPIHIKRQISKRVIHSLTLGP